VTNKFIVTGPFIVDFVAPSVRLVVEVETRSADAMIRLRYGELASVLIRRHAQDVRGVRSSVGGARAATNENPYRGSI